MARRDRRRATSGALAVSILVHLVLFTVLAYQAAPVFRTPPEAPPDFDLQLVPEPAFTPPTPQSSPRRVPLATHRPRPEPPPRPRSVASRAIQAPSRRPPPRAPPAPPTPPSRTTANIPAPGSASPAEQGARRGAGRWTVQGEDDQGGVRRFLRATVGCSHADYVRLTDPERAACNRRVGEEARAFGIPPDRLAGFIAAAEAQERARAEGTGPLRDLFEPCHGQGSNLDRSCINPPGRPPDE